MPNLLPAPQQPTDDKALADLWFRLVRAGMQAGLSLQDAEDLTQESVTAAAEAFDPSRGDFAGLAFTILRNKARNLLKRTKPMVPVDGASPPDPRGDPAEEIARITEAEAIDRVAASILANLSDPEAQLFLELGRVLEELGHGAVSEAARRMGLTPQEGWDLFRKIQRKARRMRLAFPAGDLEWMEPMSRGGEHHLRRYRHYLEECSIQPSVVSKGEAEVRDALLASSASWETVSRPSALVVTAEAIRRPWAGFRRFLSDIGDGMRVRIAGMLG